MAITINGSGTITGISAGGLPDGSVTAADLADTYLTPTGDGSGLTGIASGATDLDVWRITSNHALNTSGTDTIIKSNWSRVTGGFSVLGSGMSVDSGTGYWTFPSTGYWEVNFHYNSYIQENDQAVRGFVYFNNGSTRIMGECRAQTHYGASAGGGNYPYRDGSLTTILDVTNASTDYMYIVGIYGGGSNLSYMRGSSNLVTWVTFKKLGDT